MRILGQFFLTIGNFFLELVAGGTQTANRKLTINVGDADRTITLTDNVTLPQSGGSGSVTSIDVSGGTTGLTFSGGPVTSSGTITASGTLALTNGGTGATTASGARTNLELGTAAVENIGTSAATVPLLNGSNTWSGAQSFTAGSLRLLDSNSSHSTVLTLGTNLTANTVFTITLGNVSRELIMTADTTLSGGTHSGTNTGDQDLSGYLTSATAAATYLTITAATLAYQPLDGDLTALAALTGTNNIYYRSAANTWTSVTIAASLSFSAGTLAIATAGVTSAMLRNSAALSVIGRSANTSGVPADIAAANDAEVLRRSGTTIGFGTVATAGIGDNQVTLAKLATQAADTILANATTGAAVPTAVAISASQIVGRTASSRVKGMTGTEVTALLDVVVAAGASAAQGLVPSPGATAHTNAPYYLGDAAAFVKPLGRILGSSYVATEETTTSTSAVDLTTTQHLTFTIDVISDVLVIVSASAYCTTAGGVCTLTVDLDGSDTDATADSKASSSTIYAQAAVIKLSSLSAASHTIKLQFKVSAGTGGFKQRGIAVLLA